MPPRLQRADAMRNGCSLSFRHRALFAFGIIALAASLSGVSAAQSAADPTKLATASGTPTTPTAAPTVSGLQSGTGAPGGLQLPAPQNPLFRIPAAENPRVLIVAVEGQSVDPSTIDPQVQYSLRSIRLLLSRYNVLMFSSKDILTAEDASTFCNGPFQNYPLLRVSFTKIPATQNVYTSGYHLRVEIAGTEYVCSGAGLQPTGEVVTGIEDHTYVANPFSALAAALAFLTSPWINKYKTWLTGPTAVMGSFEHVSDAANGVTYCATARMLSKLLSSPRWHAIISPYPPGVSDPINLPCTPARQSDVREAQRRQAQYLERTPGASPEVSPTP